MEKIVNSEQLETSDLDNAVEEVKKLRETLLQAKKRGSNNVIWAIVIAVLFLIAVMMYINYRNSQTNG